MCPNAEMCKGCFWWRNVQSNGATGYKDKACHKLLMTGERWERSSQGCLSKKLIRRTKR